jgi:ribose 5-phosphate isomerase A
VIVSSDKAVERIGPPVPLELLRFGLDATLAALGDVRLRPAQPSPDGGVIADYVGRVRGPRGAGGAPRRPPGVIGHGIFPPALTADVLIGMADGRVEHRVLR